MTSEQVIEILTPLVLSVLSAALAFAAKYLREKANNEVAARAITLLDEVVIVSVREVQQVYVAALKAASADGKLTDGEKAAAKAKALARAKELLAEHGLAALKRAFGIQGERVDALLGAKIEAQVLNQRPLA